MQTLTTKDPHEHLCFIWHVLLKTIKNSAQLVSLDVKSRQSWIIFSQFSPFQLYAPGAPSNRNWLSLAKDAP